MANQELISPVGTKNPEFVITTASVNHTPIELDGQPASAEKIAEMQAAQNGEQIGADELKRRQELISERKSDPAVLVDIPQTPNPEELAKSGAGILDEAGAAVRT